jgi:hypothetical protein
MAHTEDTAERQTTTTNKQVNEDEAKVEWRNYDLSKLRTMTPWNQ